MQSGSNSTVFISYAREDARHAEKLYNDLKNAGVKPWRDKDSLKAGENWKVAISKAIKNSRYFIPMFSSNSVDKIGYVQAEFKYAIEALDRYPESGIYIIPVRLDNCEISYEKLESLTYADLFPDWDKGLKQIFESMGIEPKEKQKIEENEVNWRMGLSDKDWNDLLTAICKKKCIPFIGQGVFTLQSADGKALIPLSQEIIDKWKEKYRLRSLYHNVTQIERETGLQDTYLGFPFLVGHVNDNELTYVRGPIVLFPVSIENKQEEKPVGIWYHYKRNHQH